MTKEQIVDLLAENELAIKQLYEFYAKTFPEEASFWLSIASQEKEHAEALLSLKEKLDDINVYFDEKRFTPEAIQSTKDYIDERIKYVIDNKIDILTALSIARDLENSLIERNYFKVFESDTPEIKNVLKKLETETLKHRKMVEDKYEEIENQQ